MENKQKSIAPEILILTEFGRRDRSAAEIALRMATCLGTDILLLNAMTAAERRFDEDDPIAETDCTAETDRLRSLCKDGKVNIRGLVVSGELWDNVRELEESRNIIMVVMGGRPAVDDYGYFCSDVERIIRSSAAPVLVIPEKCIKMANICQT